MTGVQSPSAYVAAAVVLGLAGGWLFHSVWRRLLPRAWSREFWTTVPVSARGMLTSESTPDLLHHYRTLIVSLARYAGRNLLAVFVAMIPIIVIALVLSALDPSARLAKSIEVHPATAVAAAASAPGRWRAADDGLVISRSALGDSPVRLAGRILDASALKEKQALCASTVSCMLLDMMLFETHSAAASMRARLHEPVIVRPLLLNGNPFWPYLNDLDFGFFIALMSGGAAAALWGRRRDTRS
jgi:hypothetical protein